MFTMFRRRTRTGLRALSCAAALLGLLAAARPALASDAYLAPYLVKYDAADEEANQTTITGSGSPTENTGTHIFISDRTTITAHWPLSHGAGCQELPDKRVSCVLEDDFIEVSLADRNDSFDMQHTSPEVRASVSGGPGNDGLRGGPASDLLFGSDGADTLKGRGGPDLLSGHGGTDTADYSERSGPVTVTLPEPTAPFTGPIVTGASSIFDPAPRPEWPVPAGDDGEAGEGDDVQADVENIWGGAGGDDLIGSSAGNRITGIWGDDYIDGNAGNDILLGRAGADALRGGAGNDVIDALDGEKDWIECGPGYDRVWADPFDYVGDFAVGRSRDALTVIEGPPSGQFVEAGGGCEDFDPDFPRP